MRILSRHYIINIIQLCSEQTESANSNDFTEYDMFMSYFIFRHGPSKYVKIIISYYKCYYLLRSVIQTLFSL